MSKGTWVGWKDLAYMTGIMGTLSFQSSVLDQQCFSSLIAIINILCCTLIKDETILIAKNPIKCDVNQRKKLEMREEEDQRLLTPKTMLYI